VCVCVCAHLLIRVESAKKESCRRCVFFCVCVCVCVCVVSKLFSRRRGWVRVGCLERLEGFEGFVERERERVGGVVVGVGGVVVVVVVVGVGWRGGVFGTWDLGG